MTHYVHQLDPFAIQFTETMGIRWYGLAYLGGFLSTYLISVWLAKRGRIQLSVEKAGDFITWVAIGTLAGARLGYCLFYSPELFIQFGSSFPFWGVLEVHKGGMSSHGGIVGVMFVCWWFAKRGGFSALHLIDLTAYSGAIGIIFGRIANFINGELYGRVAPEAYKWAVKFPTELHYWANYKVQELKRLIPALGSLEPVKNSKGQTLVFDADKWLEWVNRYRLDSVAYDNVNSVIEKVIWSTQNGKTEVIEALQTVLTPRYPSQLFQFFLEGFLVWLVMTIVWFKPRKAGIIAGVFGFSYSVARIVGEQYRMPDAHIGFQWLGLTRGQWLSVGFIFFVIGFLTVALKMDNPKLGGFLQNSK